MFVPTGIDGEYWIFNKGAQSGSGELLTLPDGYTNLGQWELIGDAETEDYVPDNLDMYRQKFIPETAGSFYQIRLRYQIYKPTYLNARTSGLLTSRSKKGKTDEEQKFKLIKGEKARCDDILISSMFWNHSNNTIQDFVTNLCNEEEEGRIPGPKALKLKKLVFINNKGGKNDVTIYKHGCNIIKTDFDDTRSPCKTLEFNGKEALSFKVTNELRNSEEIWAVVGEAMFWTANVALAVASAGSSTSVSAGLTAVGIATSTITSVTDIVNSNNKTESIVIGATHLETSTFAIIDAIPELIPENISVAGNVALLLTDGISVIEKATEINNAGTPFPKDLFLEEFGLTEDIRPEFKNYIPQRYIMVVKGQAFKHLMKDWKFTKQDHGVPFYNGKESFDKMYYGGGVAYFFNN